MLQRLDETLDAYQKKLIDWVSGLPLAQLRASLSSETHAQRVEVSALLQICLESEAVPNRLLHIVDYLITLLSAGRSDGTWVMDLDPADLNDVIRARCAACRIEPVAESRIANRFERAAEAVARLEDAAGVLREITAYKPEVARFYFAPAILRSIVAYNITARNHVRSRVQRGRALDAEIEGDLGLFAPLQRDDPRAARRAGEGGLTAREAPGVLAVAEAIRRRLVDEAAADGPARRVAGALDLGLLEEADREAFLDPQQSGAPLLIRSTVVLGHLAMVHAEHEADLAALSLTAEQIDAWICALAEEVQREMDTLIRGNRFEGAIRLGDVKSRYLSAVRIVARRRLGRAVRARQDVSFARAATDLLREYLDRDRLRFRAPMFNHLFGGGWRRTAALWSLGLLIAFLGIGDILPSRDPRRVDEFDPRQAHRIDPLLESGYRDHAADRSMFIGTLAKSWADLDPAQRRAHAELIRDRAVEAGVAELLLFDSDHVMQAHWADGQWREASWDR